MVKLVQPATEPAGTEQLDETVAEAAPEPEPAAEAAPEPEPESAEPVAEAAAGETSEES